MKILQIRNQMGSMLQTRLPLAPLLIFSFFVFQGNAFIQVQSIEKKMLDEFINPENYCVEDLDFSFEKVAQYHFEIEQEISNFNLEGIDFSRREILLEMKHEMSELNDKLTAVSLDLKKLSVDRKRKRELLKKSILTQLFEIENRVLDIEFTLNSTIEGRWDLDRSDLDRKIVEGEICQ